MNRQCTENTECDHEETDFSEEEFYFNRYGLTKDEMTRLKAKGMVLKPVNDMVEQRWEETNVYGGNPPWSMDAVRQEHEQYWDEVHRLLAEDASSL